MFDYKEIENRIREVSARSITENVFEGSFFPQIIKNEEHLMIVERRSLGSLTMYLSIILVIVGLTIYLIFYSEGGVFYGIVFLLICLIGLGFAVNKILQNPYKRVYVFDKNQNFYKIISSTLLNKDEIVGRLDDIKKVNIQVTKYENADYKISYSYYAYLESDNLLAYRDSNIVQLQIGEGHSEYGETKSEQIAAAVADFLNLPAPEKTGDVPQNNGSGFMDGFSLLK